MCVERTARTKEPSARRSRASVACQKRAAARGAMLDCVCVVVALMFNRVKIAQVRRAIYPETSGKVLLDAGGCRRSFKLRRARGGRRPREKGAYAVRR